MLEGFAIFGVAVLYIIFMTAFVFLNWGFRKFDWENGESGIGLALIVGYFIWAICFIFFIIKTIKIS